MRFYRDMALAFLAVTFGVWFFQDTLSQNLMDENRMRQNILATTVLMVGDGKCSAKINLSTWDDLNQLAIYRWVVACEEATK